MIGGAILPQSTFFVATNGNDANPGTIASPFLTPGRAQTAVRAALAAGVKDPVVDFRGGIYPITSTLALTSADSAASGHTVTWQSHVGENAIFSGGAQVSGWTVCVTADAICNSGDGTTYQATITDPANFREFYFCPDGTFSTCLHRPRAHGSEGASVGGFTHNTSTGATTASSGTVYGAMSSFANKTDMEVIGLWTWGNTHCKVASIAGTPPVVTLNTACSSRFGWINTNGFDTVWPLWIENAYEFLVPPDPAGGGRSGCGALSGCWYLNRTTHVLYYQPKAGENMATAIAYVPKLEKLVSGTGAANITFSRLTFAFDSWLGTDTAGAYVPMVSGQHCSTTACTDFAAGTGEAMHGALEFDGTSHDLTFNHDLFAHNAARTLLFRARFQTSTIYANDFEDNGGGALQYGENTEPTQATSGLQTCCLTLKDNKFNSGSFEYQDADEYFAPFVRTSLVTLNEFDSVGRGPISTGWGGTANVVPSSYSTDHTISNNFINSYCAAGDGFNGELGDCGAIYNSGPPVSPYITWTGNYVKTGHNSNFGALYPDENSAHVTISSNVIEASAVRSIYIWTASINNITATAPWYCTNCAVLDSGTSDSIAAGTSYTAGSPPPGAQTIINAAGIEGGVTPGP